jgi:hypothetical protein
MKYNNDVEFLNARASTNARLVIQNIGGTRPLLQLFKGNENFTQIKGVSGKLSLELKRLCNQLVKNNIPVSKISETTSDSANARIFALEYDHFKSMLSIRAQHHLDQIEGQYDQISIARRKRDITYKFIYGKIDLRKFRSLGESTAKEINSFFKKVIYAYLNGYSINSPRYKISKAIKPAMANSFLKTQEFESKSILNSKGNYDFVNGMALYIRGAKKKASYTKFVNEFYFKYDEKDIDKYAQSLKQTISSVRMRLSNINKEIIPEGIDFLFSKFGEKLIFNYGKDVNGLVKINLDELKRNKKLSYTDLRSVFFTSVVNAYYAKHGYVSLSSIINSNSSKFHFFDVNSKLIYCKIDNCNEIGLTKAITVFHTKIKNCLNKGLEIDIEKLTGEIIKEVKLKLTPTSTLQFVRAFKCIVKKADQMVHTERHDKSVQKQKIIQYAVKFITRRNKGVTLDEIISYLKKKEIETYGVYLNYLFTKFSNVISHTYLNGWVLTEWLNTRYKSKSFKDFIFEQLEASKDPIHILEMHRKLSRRSPITLKRLNSDLHYVRKFGVVMLNCGFIALKDKKYAAKWGKLPAVKSGILHNYFKKIKTKTEFNKIAAQIEKTKRVPKIHSLYYYELKKQNLNTT